MSDQIEYKCPNCGGAIVFDTASQKVKCPFCDTEFELEALQKYDEDIKMTSPDNMNWDTAMGSEWNAEERNSIRVYLCESCGGEVVGDAVMAASKCPYCDNPIIVKGMLSGELKPDYVIPFKLDKKAAVEGMSKHLKGKKLLPKIFKNENHIDEIKGIYVPFWLFDADANAHIRYKATKVHTWSDSNYDYTETKYFSVYRSGDISFEHVPADGSEKMDDEMMESIEPFYYNEAVPFQTAYLSGYLADKYDVSEQDNIERVNRRIKNSTENSFASTVRGYSSVLTEDSNISLSRTNASYALYPVWILNTTWRGKKYTFAMNGQTGKFVGDLPMDKGALFKWLFGIWGAVSAAAFALTSLVWYFM